MNQFAAQVTAVSLAGMAALSSPAGQSSSVKWPDGAQAAVVLTYDDSLRSQLDVAVPQLDRAGFKGTFFLSGTFAQEDVERWRKVAASGHELGNHSVFHPCARGTFDMPEQYNNERYSVRTMLTEIRTMNTLLHAIDGGADRTLRDAMRPVRCGRRRLHGRAARVRTGEIRAGTGPNGAGPIDPFNTPGMFFPETVTGADLIAYVEDAHRRGGLAVLGFHGVGGDYLKVSAEAHQQLVTYLHDHRDVFWVATFRQAMDETQSAH